MLDGALYRAIRSRLIELGYGDDYTWSEGVRAPASAEALAREYVWVVLNSGMRSMVARRIMERVWPRLLSGDNIAPVFGHPGKVAGIELVWTARAELYRSFLDADDVVAWCEALPWIGKITKYHLAKNLGADVAKPDRWLERLAAAEGDTVDGLCARIARETCDRIATVDVVLWRACAVGILTVQKTRTGWHITHAIEVSR